MIIWNVNWIHYFCHLILFSSTSISKWVKIRSTNTLLYITSTFFCTSYFCLIPTIQHYVIKFVSYLLQVSGFLRVLWFPPPIKRLPWYNWNIVESGVKHHNQNRTYVFLMPSITFTMLVYWNLSLIFFFHLSTCSINVYI